MTNFIGLDIGGTRIRAASAGKDGRIQQQLQSPTPAALDEGLLLLDEMVATLSGDKRIDAIGAAVGGPLDHIRGVVSPLHQPQWRQVPLKALMEESWGCPFYVEVDTDVAALGEYGAISEKVGRLLYITMSTGLGGGLLIDGEIYRGGSGRHPEIGHQAIPYRCANPSGVACECGGPDCLEALISGNAIRRIYGKVAEALNEREWAEVAYNLGQGLRNVSVIYAPDLIVLGGGVALGGGRSLIESALEVLRSRLRILPIPDIRLTQLGPDTPLIGALELARSIRRTR